MTVQRVLTGITTSGTPHLGNYAGAIRPAVAASRQPGVESFYFLADYHALIKTTDPLRVQRSTLEIAATWIAAGLDTDRVWFYRQSDIPEIPELTWLLTCVCGKGLLNRAHAYKAAVDRNTAEGVDPDAGVNMGLYMYPVLMAADILMFKAHLCRSDATRSSTSRWHATWRAASITCTVSISCCPRPPLTLRSLPCPGWMAAR